MFQVVVLAQALDTSISPKFCFCGRLKARCDKRGTTRTMVIDLLARQVADSLCSSLFNVHQEGMSHVVP